MKLIFTCLTAIIFGQVALSQDGTFYDWQEDLYPITNQKRLFKTIDRIEELDRFFFGDRDKVVFELESDRRWRFMFAKRAGWEQVVFQEAEDQLAYFLSENMTPMTGKDLTEMFGLTGPPKKVNPLNIVHFSNERFEEVFAMRAKNEPYAVVVYVYSYANGNMTSWFKEMRYYFI